jgi:hypothetical protein
MEKHNRYSLLGLKALRRAVAKVAENARKNNYKIPLYGRMAALNMKYLKESPNKRMQRNLGADAPRSAEPAVMVLN